MNVQAIINNISFPKTLQQLEYFIDENKCFNVENILYDKTVEWTVPKWILPNDIVFFFHAKTAIDIIHRLKRELNFSKELYRYNLLSDWLKRAEDLYHLYGGKIFAVARVKGTPFYYEETFYLHWNGKIYAEIEDIYVLENPVDISSFSDFIRISRQSSITAVMNEDFKRLKKTISETNKLPGYFIKSEATPIPLKEINSENWLELNQEYRRAYFLEIQFRKFYVDYLLKVISDRKKIFSECACYKNDRLIGYVDNCIWFDKRLIFVEVKLNFDTERNFVGQLIKYSNVESAVLENGRRCFTNIEQRYVIVIDTQHIGIFDSLSKRISIVADLDMIKSKTDLERLRYVIIVTLKYLTDSQ